jgi:hypothetical protein
MVARSLSSKDASPARQGLYEPGRDGGRAHRVLGGSIADGGGADPPPAAILAQPGARRVARRFGPELVLATIAAKEEVDQNACLKQPETARPGCRRKSGGMRRCSNSS